MKQLKLFNPTQSLQPNLKRSKKSRKPITPRQPDLWTQEREEEKEMALFFLDIRNFTPFVESHQAFDVIQVVRRLFSVFQNIIRNNHGQIIETSGDGFYAAFGFDRDIREAVNAAVKAGRSILESLEVLNERSLKQSLGRKMEVGIGLHAGRVATGTIHLNGKDHLIVMGYPVNIASRLEAATKELNNSFVVSSTAFHLLENPPANRPTTSIRLKGVAGTCRIHLLGQPYGEN